MTRLLAAFAFAFLAPPAFADATLGELRIERPMLRETPPNAPVAGGFVTLGNAGATDDTLVSATTEADFVGQVQLHRMEMENGVMRMSEVEGGIPVPAGETVVLQPGGLHLMLMGLTAPLIEGETLPITLTFERAGTVTLDFPVMNLADIRAAAGGAMEGGGTSGAGN